VGSVSENMTSFTKPEIQKLSRRRQRRTEPRPQPTCTDNSVQFDHGIFEICEWTYIQTDRQTDRHADHNTSCLSRGFSVLSKRLAGKSISKITYFDEWDITAVNLNLLILHGAFFIVHCCDVYEYMCLKLYFFVKKCWFLFYGFSSGLGWVLGQNSHHGTGWVGSVIWCVGLVWVEEIGPMDNAEHCPMLIYKAAAVVTDRISTVSNAIASVRPSVRRSVFASSFKRNDL